MLHVVNVTEPKTSEFDISTCTIYSDLQKMLNVCSCAYDSVFQCIDRKLPLKWKGYSTTACTYLLTLGVGIANRSTNCATGKN